MSDNKLSRRSFFGVIGGGAVAAIVPDIVPVQEIKLKLIPPGPYCPPGFPKYSSFSDMVTTTLKNHSDMLADNVSKNNALYLKLKRMCDDA